MPGTRRAATTTARHCGGSAASVASSGSEVASASRSQRARQSTSEEVLTNAPWLMPGDGHSIDATAPSSSSASANATRRRLPFVILRQSRTMSW
jgi:hypothetical protein